MVGGRTASGGKSWGSSKENDASKDCSSGDGDGERASKGWVVTGTVATGEVSPTDSSGEVGAREGAGTDVGTIEENIGVVLAPKA